MNLFVRIVGALAAGAILLGANAFAQEVNADIVNHIRNEGYLHSQVMNYMTELTDDFGPRLTASPQKRAADRWAMNKMKEVGLSNVHAEGFDFGPGWSSGRVSVFMTSPQQRQLHVVPVAWTPGTNGVVKADAVAVDIQSEADFERYRGKLKGKVVFLDPARAPETPSGEIVKRYSDEDLKQIEQFQAPKPGPDPERLEFSEHYQFTLARKDFLGQEGVVATVSSSKLDAGIIHTGTNTFIPGMQPAFPMLMMALEPYNKIIRLLNDEKPVSLELNVEAKFHDDDPRGYNIIGEIPGSGGNGEVVMLGAHLDSWHAGDGAVDDGTGVAAVLEAMRILKALGVKPKRTIRVALWSGEEQGMMGSRAYVEQHFASRPLPKDPLERFLTWIATDFNSPLTVKPAHEKLSVYFNHDLGSGRFRGVYAEGNAAAAAIFEEWLAPFHDLGATTVTLNSFQGTDSESFDVAGLPGFQFIQDGLDYWTRLHHTDLDTLDYVVEDDLKQHAVILASFAYNGAMADKRFPRKPMPKKHD